MTGAYDFKLEATLLSRLNRDPEASDITIFTAIQEQLGLKLEPQKTTMQVFVIDNAERPSAN